MKLLLTSVIPTDLKPFLRLFGKNKRPHIAMIPTASNNTDNESYIAERTAQFQNGGFATTVVNLETYITGDASTYDGCWVLGGNTFYLNYWLSKSGFDTELPHLLAQGFVYGGESAGAVVAGKTLHGIELLDNPADTPDIIWEGLGLVNDGILPHWGSSTYAGRLSQAYEEMRLFGPVKTLTDADSIVIS